MDSEKKNETAPADAPADDSLKEAEKVFRQLCMKILHMENPPKRSLFPNVERKKVPLRPSMIDRACSKKAVVSSTPMTCAKNKAFTPNSLGSLSPIDDNKINLQPEVRLSRIDLSKPQNESVVELSSLVTSVEENRIEPVKDQGISACDFPLSKNTSQTAKSKKLDTIISKLVRNHEKSDLHITNKTVQTSTNLLNVNIKKLARSYLQEAAKERQTQTGASLERNFLHRDSGGTSSDSASNTSESDRIIRKCDRRKLLRTDVNSALGVSKELIDKLPPLNPAVPWRAPSGLEEHVPNSDSLPAMESMEDTLDDTFLPKQPKRKKVFMNKKKAGKPKNSPKKKNHKPVPEQSRSRILKKTPVKESEDTASGSKDASTTNQEPNLSDSNFLRLPKEKKSRKGSKLLASDKITRANKKDLGDSTFRELHLDEEKQKNKVITESAGKKKKEVRAKKVNGAIFDEISSEGDRLHNLAEKAKTDKPRSPKDKLDKNFNKSNKKGKVKEDILQHTPEDLSQTNVIPIDELDRSKVQKLQNSSIHKSPLKRRKEKENRVEEDILQDVENLADRSIKNRKKSPKKQVNTENKKSAPKDKNRNVTKTSVVVNELENNEENFSSDTGTEKHASRRTSPRKKLKDQVSSDDTPLQLERQQLPTKKRSRQCNRNLEKIESVEEVEASESVGPRRSGRTRRQAVKATAGVVIVNTQSAYARLMKGFTVNQNDKSPITSNREISRHNRKVSSTSKRKVSSTNKRKVSSTSNRKVSSTSNSKTSSKVFPLSTVSTISPIVEEQNEAEFEVPAIPETAVASTSSEDARKSKSKEHYTRTGKVTKRQNTRSIQKKIQTSVKEIINKDPDTMWNILNICDGNTIRTMKWAFQNPEFKEVKGMAGVSTAFIEGASHGLLKINSGKCKPKQVTVNHMMSFYVSKGQAEVAVQDKCGSFKEGDTFLVPPGGEYYIKNSSVKKQLLLFFTKFPKSAQ